MCALSGAIRLVTQRSGHVGRHAPVGSLRWDSGFGQIRTHGRVLERLTWLKQGDGPDQNSRVLRPTLGRPELPAADSSFFARDCGGRGQSRGLSARCWAPVGRVARACQLVGLWRFELCGWWRKRRNASLWQEDIKRRKAVRISSEFGTCNPLL